MELSLLHSRGVPIQNARAGSLAQQEYEMSAFPSTNAFPVGRRLGIALPLSALLVAAVLVIQANPAAATQLGNQITVSGTDVVSAGIGQMRGLGEGSIAIDVPEGSTVTQALLYWHGPTNSELPESNAAVMFAETPVLGTNIGTSHDNCWLFANSQAYRADVTDLVPGGGTYTLSGFRKAVGEEVIADVNGVSLIVFFDDGDSSNDKDVTLIDGNDSNATNVFDPDGWDATLSDVVYTSGDATLQLHVGDGQSFDDDILTLNDSGLEASFFHGDSVPSAGGPDPNPEGVTGNLWDIKEFGITSFMSVGSNDLHLSSGIVADCLSLLVAMAIVDVPPSASADLSIDKSDDPPYGPDPVSSGQLTTYGVSVTNNGPDPATGITVTDTSEGGTVQSGSGSDWSCDPVVENTLTCHYTGNEGVLPADSTASPLTVVVRAPDNPGSEDITMTDTASVTAEQPDPVSENNSDSEDTTVLGTTSESSEDHAAGFFDNVNTLTIATDRDETGRFYSSLTIHPDPGLEPGVVTIDEFPATEPPYNMLCGNKACDAQVQVTVLPAGQAAADNAMEVHLIYVKDKKQGSTIWVKGDGEAFGSVVQNCTTRGIADPPKCVNSKKILRNGDRDIMLLWRDGGDPWGGKR
jgi:uncharacterized repeat protein (TIGR01451 family)